MKAVRLPFLYFFSVAIGILWSINTFGQAQKKVDSLKYYYQLSINPQQPTDLTKSYEFYQRHMEKSLNNKDTTNAIFDLRMMANIQNNLGQLHDSEKTVVRALKLLNQESNKDATSATSGLYNELGMIYRALYDFDRAVTYYEKALVTSRTASDSLTIFNNMAYTYSQQGKHDLAEQLFEKVYAYSLSTDNKEFIAKALNNLGGERIKLNYPNGLQNILEALDIRVKLNDIKGLYSSYKELTKYYQKENKQDSAVHYAEKAYKIAKSLNSLSFTEDALSSLMTLRNDTLVLEYRMIKDSIAKSNQLQENKFAEMQYNYTQFQRNAQESQLAVSEQRTKTLVYQFVGLTIFLVAIFIFVLSQMRHKKENQLKVYETETRISKKVHDEVANDIFQVMTKLQTNHMANEPLLDELEDIYIKTRDISKENSGIIHTDFKTQLEDLLQSYQNSDINVITKHLKDVDWTLVSNDKKTTLYRVLQELMTNMKKHSHASMVALTFKQEKKLQIVYKDNGVGTRLNKGSGIQNIENRMASVKGSIIFESSPSTGFKATLIV